MAEININSVALKLDWVEFLEYKKHNYKYKQQQNP